MLWDVLERWETADRAQTVYGVVLTGSADDETLAVDAEATRLTRAEHAANRGVTARGS